MSRTSPIHYIAPSSISVTPNANQSANDLAVYVARGAKIKVYSPRAGINMVDSTYQEWTLTGRNRRLAESEKPYTIYARLQKNDKSKGYLVFAPKNGNAQDGWTDKYNYVTTEGWTQIAGASPAGDYYYIRLGEVSLPENNERTVDLDTGILDTDDFNNNWAASPDALPLRVELGCTINDEDAGPIPYVYWGQSLVLTASLVEGWTGTDIERFDHWEITRDTHDTAADNLWNHPTGAGSYRGMTNGSITLSHARGANDDFNGSVSAVFTVTAMERIEDENDPGNPTYEPLVSETINIHAETLEKYELVLSSRIVSFNPTSETYNPAGGVAVRVRATDQSGYVFDLTTNQITNSGIAAQYAIDGSSTWTTLTFVSDPGTGAGVATISTTPSTTPFAAQKNVNMRILSAGGEVLFSDSISYLRDGEDSKEREWIFLRSINPITFVDAPGPYQKPALISLGEVNPSGAASGNDDNKNQDGWVPNGWWDEQQGADEDHPYEYGAYRDFVRSASGNAGEGESTGGQWGSFTDPKIWSHYGGDAVTYDIVPSVSIINADAAGHVSSDGIIIQAFRIKGSERSGNILPPTTGSAYYVEYSIDGGTWTQCAMFSYQPEGEVAVQRYGIAPLSVKQAQTDIALRLKNSANPNEVLKENPPIKVVNIVSEEETQAIVEEVGDARFFRKDQADTDPHLATFGDVHVEAGLSKGSGAVSSGSLQVDGDASVAGDTELNGDVTIGASASNEAIVNAVMQVLAQMKSQNYVDDSPIGKGGWNLLSADDNGNSYMVIDKLFVRLKAIFNELELRKISYAGGNFIFSSAGSEIVGVKPLYRNGAVYAYRCYCKKDDGTTATENWWHIDDQAKCQTFNIQEGVHQNVENTYYWRKVVAVGSEIASLDGTTSEELYNYADLSLGDCDVNSDIPKAGDSIIQMGNRTDTERQGFISLEVFGSDAPAFKVYKGVNGYNLNNKMPIVISPKNTSMRVQHYEIETDYGVFPAVKERGDWPSIPEHKCYYFDRVQHNGSSWLCIYPQGSTPKYTTEEPSVNATYWKVDAQAGESAPSYTEEWYAWSNVQSVVNATTEPTPNGGWYQVIGGQGEYAYLWKKLIRYTWNSATRVYVAGTAQYYRMSGTNGTSISVKGSVATVADLPSTHADGDAYVVEADHHLYMWSDESRQWLDIGEFKGEDGKTYYTHIAWATSVTTNPSTGEVTNVTGFTIAKTADDTTHLWMGVYVDENSAADPDDALLYTWSYTKGVTGNNGYNTATLFLYKRSATAISSIDWSNTLTYTFANKTLSPIPTGWSLNTIPSGTDPIYVTAATAYSNTATDSIEPNEWAAPVKYVENGAQGEHGLNTASVFLYQRAASAPTKPSSALTYAFATGLLSGTLGDWSQNIPATDGNPCWVIQATAIGTGTTDSIAANEWSTQTKMVEDGASITKSSEANTYKVSDSGTTTPTGTWYNTKAAADADYAWSANRYMWTKTVITWSDYSTTTLYSAERNPDDGQPGMSIVIDSQSVTYSKQTSGNLDPETLTYGTYPSSLSKGDWLYSKTTVVYKKSDGTSAGSTNSYSVSYIGTDGTNGRAITGITEHYKASADATGETTPTSTDWGTTPTPSDWGASKPYLWNYEKITYSSGTTVQRTTASVVAIWTKDGAGIDSITNYYLATSAASGVTPSTSGWTTTVQAMTETNCYLWNYEVIAYTQGKAATTTTPHIIGHYGKDADVWTIGNDGYWYCNGVKTNTKAEGTDGTGVEIKGGVDVLFNADKTSQSQTSLEGLTGMTVGECYTVTSNKHLYFYDGTTAASAANPSGWRDLGKFSGDDGVSSYMHIAYADDVTFDAQGHPTSCTGFTVTKQKEAYDWMGLCTNDSQTDPTTYTAYEWNKVKGEDGADLGENYINNSLSPFVVTANGSASQDVASDKAYDPSYLPAAGTKVAVRARITFSGCSLNSNAHVLIYSKWSSSWQEILRFYPDTTNVNQEYEVVDKVSTLDTRVASPDGKLYVRLANFKAQGTVTFERIKMEVGEKSSAWSLSESDKRITKKSEIPYYIKNTTGVRPAENDPNWSTTKPALGQGEWLFTKTVITWSDNTTTVLYGDERNPNDGAAGMSIVIDSQSVQYCKSATQVADPSSLTYGNYPSYLSKGDWLYSKTTVTYKKSDGTSAGNTVSYGVTYIGEDGEDGNDGTSVTVSSTETKYAVTQTSSQPADSQFTYSSIPVLSLGDYLWSRETIVFSDTKSIKAYSVSRIGTDGSDGTPGSNGSSTHFAYATSADGSQNFSTSNFAGATYIGTYTDTTVADSTNYRDYAWSKLKGDNGTSITITSQSVTYQQGDSGTTAPTGTWSSTIPSVTQGKFLWTKTVVNYSDNTSTTSYSVSRQATNGSAGRGISGVTEHYNASANASGETRPSTDWGTDPMPSDWNADKPYLWNYEKITYTSGDPTYTTPSVVAVWTEDGRGIDSITNYYLATNLSSGVTKSTSGWTTTIQTISSDKPYLWNYEKVTYTDSDFDETDPHIIGHYGKDGTSVQAQYSSDQTNWHDTFQTGDKWMRTRTTGGSWSNAMKIVGENGEDGDYTDFTFGISQYLTTANVNTAPADISTWSDAPLATTDEKPYLWSKQVKHTFNNGTETTSAPKYIRLTGEQGENAHYLYIRGTARDDDESKPYVTRVVNVDGGSNMVSSQAGIGIEVTVIDRDTLEPASVIPNGDGTYVSSKRFDTYTYADSRGRAGLLAALQAITTSQYFVCLTSFDACIWDDAIVTELYSFGMQDYDWRNDPHRHRDDTSEQWRWCRSPFAFLGYRGLEKGYGIKVQQFAAANVLPAEISVYVANGVFVSNKDGGNGENAVQLTLDNQHEDFLYRDDGTLVAPQNGATSQAHLFDGATEKTPTWAVSVNGGSSYVSSSDSYSTGSVAKAKISSSGLLTVSEIYVATAVVKVRATYNGDYYYADFTANKTSQDRYELIVRPNAIAFNSDDTWADKTISLSAERTDLQGGKSTPTISTGNTYAAGQFRIFWGYVKSDGKIYKPSATTTEGTDDLKATSKVVSQTEGNTYIGIYFELRLYTSASAYRMCDFETVEIAKTANGAAGTSPYFADIDNEMDSVACGTDGKPTQSTTLETTVSMWHGTTLQNITSVKVNGTAISTTAKTIGIFSVKYVAVDTKKRKIQVTVGISSVLPLTNSLAIEISDGTETRNLSFVINGVRPGAKGDAATIYSLVPSTSSIKRDKNNTLTPASPMTCDVRKIVGNTTPTRATSSDGTLRYRVDGDITSSSDGTALTINTGNVAYTSSNSYIVFAFFVGTTMVDKERVPIVYDGNDAPNLGENLIDFSEPPCVMDVSNPTSTWTDVGGNEYRQITIDKVYRYDRLENNMQVTAQAKVTFNGCAIMDGKTGNFVVYARGLGQSGGGWTSAVEVVSKYGLSGTLEGVYEMEKTFTFGSDVDSYDGMLFMRIGNFKPQGTITIELMKMEVGPVATSWCLSENDKTGRGIRLSLKRDIYTEVQWNTWCAIGYTGSWSFRTGDPNFLVCKVGDYFTISGIATDSKKKHASTHKCTSVNSGSITGTVTEHITDGDAGIDVSLQDPVAIFTQNVTTNVVSSEKPKTNIIVTRGGVPVALSEYTVAKPSAIPSDVNCNYTVTNNNSEKSVEITSIWTAETIEGVNYPEEQGYAPIRVTYQEQTYDLNFKFYCNAMGKFKRTVEGDVETSIANMTWFEYNPATGQYDKTTTMGDFIRSSSKNTSVLTDKTNGAITSMSEMLQRVDGISLNVYDDSNVVDLFTHDADISIKSSMSSTGTIPTVASSVNVRTICVSIPVTMRRDVTTSIAMQIQTKASSSGSVIETLVQTFPITNGVLTTSNNKGRLDVLEEYTDSNKNYLRGVLYFEKTFTNDFKVVVVQARYTSNDAETVFLKSRNFLVGGISMKAGLKATGIDIEAGKIINTADQWECQNTSGVKTVWLDDMGNFTVRGVYNNLITVIDSTNWEKYIIKIGSGTSAKFYLDVLRCGTFVMINYLPVSDFNAASDGMLHLPYYANDNYYTKGYTRYLASSTSTPRLMTADELRMLAERKMVIKWNAFEGISNNRSLGYVFRPKVYYGSSTITTSLLDSRLRDLYAGEKHCISIDPSDTTVNRSPSLYVPKTFFMSFNLVKFHTSQSASDYSWGYIWMADDDSGSAVKDDINWD